MKIRTLILTLTVGVGVTVIAACDDGPLQPNADPSASFVPVDARHASEGTNPAFHMAEGLHVLSRNVFLGGDLEPVVDAAETGNPQAIAVAVAQAWAQIEANDFPIRARTIAREIAASGADVVGLQEVALFHTQFPGDGPASPATEVAYDYLQILLDELEARGSRYSVAASGPSIQVELPAADPTSPTGIRDIRYTDRDVVLVREGVEVTGTDSDIYEARLAIPGVLALPRGFNRVDLIHEGQAYHFVNTHLETDEAAGGFGAVIQAKQAKELVDLLDGISVPTIVVGDLNGQPTSEMDGTEVYEIMELIGGFTDAWTPHASNPDGYTCCFDKDLAVDPSKGLYERIDYVFVRDGSERPVDVVDSFTVGAGQQYGVVEDDRWPSDHAGVFAALLPVSAPVAD